MAIFARDAVKHWRRTVHNELRRMRLTPEGPVYPAAMVTAAVYCFGTDLDVLVEASGHQAEYVKRVLKRLRQQRVLNGPRLRVAWQDEKHGDLAWFLDAMVACGDLVRPVDPKRSAAHKGRHSGPRQPRAVRVKPEPRTPFRPAVVKSNPLYYLDESSKKR